MDEFQGVSFNRYRSIGKTPVKLFPLRKINFIIGQNNVGKSNIIRFLSEVLSRVFSDFFKKGMTLGYSSLDYNIGSSKNDDVIIGFPLLVNKVDDYISSIIHESWKGDRNYLPDGRVYNHFRRILLSEFFRKGNEDEIWFNYCYSPQSKQFSLSLDRPSFAGFFNGTNILSEVLRAIDGPNHYRSGVSVNGTIDSLLSKLKFLPVNFPKTIVVPAIRKVGESKGIDINNGGDGVILQLAKLQNPELDRQFERDKFNKINEFLETVLENKGAKIEIPFERDMILVHMDGKVLPLDSLGTGIHEVIILAVTATVHENSIICIEEPELHLHPLLQRKLVKYINEKTNNKYIFTTHSAHLLDSADAEVFHISKIDDDIMVDAVYNNGQKTKICKELGYKASDILQANCVIWVEGPSDRTYVNFWIRSKNTSLIEGIHYSIMFYGGRLLSHLAACDSDAAEEFISLLSLNRNTAIVLDSDKSSAHSSINTTKKRIIKELVENNGYAWLTKGREVENYLDANLVELCAKEVHPRKLKSLQNKGTYDNVLKYIPIRTKKTNVDYVADKVSVAKLYVEKFDANFKILDLESKVNELVNFICVANY